MATMSDTRRAAPHFGSSAVAARTIISSVAGVSQRQGRAAPTAHYNAVLAIDWVPGIVDLAAMVIFLKWALHVLVFLLVLLSGPAFIAASSSFQPERNWYDADRSSAGIAPRPEQSPEAIVQVYSARAFSWRGYFAVHTWLAVKPPGALAYTVYDVTGWRASTVRTRTAEPDAAWFGSAPKLLADLRGAQAEAAIPKIADAVAAYPYPNRYDAWPGPNSNTFTAWVTRQVPELKVAFPNTAIGKDYLGEGFVSATPSGSGYQLSLYGYLGLLASVREGLELNVLGLSFGIDPLALAVKLPGIGHVGWREPWISKAPVSVGG